MGGNNQSRKRKEVKSFSEGRKRILSIFLSIVLCVSLVNLNAFAEEIASFDDATANEKEVASFEEIVDENNAEGTSEDPVVDPEIEEGTGENQGTANEISALNVETLETEGEPIEALSDTDDYIGLFITDKKGKITGFSFDAEHTPTDIVIPSEIKGETITAIGDKVFSGLGLTSVVIPSTVKSIGASAFSGNPLTGGVTLSEGLQTIGGTAFKDCGLTSIVIPNSVTSMGWGAFHSCKELASVTLPNNPNFDFKGAGCGFYNCKALQSIVIPNSVTTIPDQMFNGCTSLESIILSDNILTIGSGVFSSAKASYIKIPSKVTSIGSGSFGGWGDAIIHLPDHFPGTIEGSPWGAKGTTSVVWKEIEESCFYFDPDSQTIIGFKQGGHIDCKHPEWHDANANVEIPATIKVEGVPYDVLALDAHVLYGNTNIAGVTFETGCKITTIPASAFESCKSLASVVLPEGITDIEVNAFNACGSLKSITFPTSLKNIGDYAFMSTGLTSTTKKPLVFPEGLLTIGNRAFNTNGVQDIVIPESVEFIDNWAFHYARTVVIKGNNPNLNIDEIAFNIEESCTDIYVEGYNKYTLPNSPWGAQYATIHWADEDEIPDVLKITDEKGDVIWHYNCVTETIIKYKGSTGQTVDLVVPKEVSYNGETYPVKALDSDTFTGTGKQFNTVTFEEGYLTEIPTFLLSGSKINEVTIPVGIEIICSNAFANSTVSKVSLPEGLTTLGISAFEGTKITEIKLPSTLNDIGGTAFKNCSGLTTVVFPDALTSVQGAAFANCNLTGEIVIPGGVTRLDGTVFDNNPNLELISVLQYRIGKGSPMSPEAVKGKQPWGATNAKVTFLGEVPEASHKVTQTDDVTGRGRIIDFTTWIPGEGLNITGIWVQQDDGALVDLFGPLSNGFTQQLQFVALENATYTFYVKNAFQTKLDPTECFSYEVVIDDIGVISMDAEDVTLSIAKKGQFTASDILDNADIVSIDADSKKNSSVDDAGFNFTISAEDMARVNSELQNIGDEIEIKLWGSYANAYDLNGDVYQQSGIYSTDASGNHLQADGTYAYTNPTYTTIKVTLTGLRVQFDLNGGNAPENASGNPYADQFVGAGEKAAKPVDPVREHQDFIGWAVDGDPNEMWDFSTKVTKDITLVAQWKDALYNYTVKHVYLDAEGNEIGEGVTVNGSGIFGSAIPYETNKTTYNNETFIFSHVNPEGKTVSADASQNTMFVYYDIDTVGTNPNPEDPDGVPDKYQVKVQYFVINGTSDISYVYVTLFDGSGKWAINGSGRLASSQIPTTQPNEGYEEDSPLWDTEPTTSLVITQNTDLTATYIEVEEEERRVEIDASDFRMSLDEARAHQAKTADEQFYEIIERGLAEAWWFDTKEDVEITGIKVVPSTGDGKSIDAAVGQYYVTYYAGLGEYEVNITVLATVYGDDPQVNEVIPPAVTPTPTPTPTPPTNPPTGGTPANDPVQEVVESVATVMEDVARSVVPVPETMISDDGTPLATSNHPWCWVHFYIILGMALSVFYAAVVILRRRSFTKRLLAFEEEILDEGKQRSSFNAGIAYPVRQTS